MLSSTRDTLRPMLRLLRNLFRKTRPFAMAVAALLVVGIVAGSGGSAFVAFLLAGSTAEHEVTMGVDEEHFSLVLRHREDSRSGSHLHQLPTQIAIVLGEESNNSSERHLLLFDRLQNASTEDSRATLAATVVKMPLMCLLVEQPTCERMQLGLRVVGNGRADRPISPGMRYSTVRLI